MLRKVCATFNVFLSGSEERSPLIENLIHVRTLGGISAKELLVTCSEEHCTIARPPLVHLRYTSPTAQTTPIICSMRRNICGSTTFSLNVIELVSGRAGLLQCFGLRHGGYDLIAERAKIWPDSNDLFLPFLPPTLCGL
jgi:hypothetical protein